MSREIKFRGKRRNDGEWIYGFFCQWQNDFYICSNPHESGFHGGQPMRFELDGWFVVDPATVGQFTGLHDKNGKEIYEGDSVNCTGWWPGVISWQSDGRIGWCVEPFEDNKCRGRYALNNGEEFEVIGNIYEKR